LVVGDRPSTDGLLARRLGLPFALVRTGVTPPGVAPTDVEPDVDVADIAAVVAHFLG
jgi:ribonucleotide monophosphatase NagD (HAD superfamily)